ncbi:MAG: methionyl-tRNA formyltransferase [Bacilli bacterium]|nr:methionyl-tRNA formyltransferase [Bacilli bacterium]
MKPRIVFMGTPSFAVPILEALIDKYNVTMVVCQPDRKKNRKGKVEYPETKKVALNHGINVFQPERIKENYKPIIDAKPDLIITCAYGQIIPDIILNYPKIGCINVHGSLLPELRGGAPIHWAIIRGYKETGITIMDMSSKMDAGDIISQASIKIDDDMILDTLYEKMSYLGRNLLIETLPSIIDNTCTRNKQDESKVTFGFNIKKEDTKIDFSKPSIDIKNLIRGLNSIPGAYCYLNNKRMKVYDIEILEKLSNKEKCGKIVTIEKDGIICTTKDNLIKIKELAIEGKKRCKAIDFLNGIKKEELVGKVFNNEEE